MILVSGGEIFLGKAKVTMPLLLLLLLPVGVVIVCGDVVLVVDGAHVASVSVSHC